MNLKKLTIFGLGILTLGVFCGATTANAEVLPVQDTLNVSITTENTLEMALSTNQISFTGYNGTQSLENNDLNITVSSGLNYDIKAKALDDFSGTTDSESKISISNLYIKADESEFKQFNGVSEEVLVVENAPNGRNNVHNITFKLEGDSSVKADTYNTVIEFEAIQK